MLEKRVNRVGRLERASEDKGKDPRGGWKMLKTRSLSVKNITSGARKAIALRRAESRHLKRTKTSSALSVNHKLQEAPGQEQFIRYDHLRGSQVRTPSRSSQATDLEQKIDVEMRVKEAACNMMEYIPMDHSQQSVEAAKNLIVSEQRMTAYKKELDTRNLLTGIGGRKQFSAGKEPTRAKLSISEMRIPLIWRERDHFKNRGDSRQFAMFAIFRVGSDVCDSALIYGIDRTCTDVAFSDVSLFENVLPGFQMSVTLYSVFLDPSRVVSGSASLRLRNRLKGSFSRSLGHKWGSVVKKQIENPAASSESNHSAVKFQPVATALLTIREAGDHAKTHDFQLHSTDEQCCPPLYGHFCCRLVVQPLSASESLMEGPLTVQMKNRSFPNLWCRLRASKLSCWRNKSDIQAFPPIIDVPINQECIMQIGRKGGCLIVSIPMMSGYAQYVLWTENEKELVRWKNCLETQIFDCKFWGPFATKCLPLGHENQESEKPYFLRMTCRNLYDEISLAGDMDHTEGSKPPCKRPSVQNLFAQSESNSEALESRNCVLSQNKAPSLSSEQLGPSEKVLLRKKTLDDASSSAKERKVRNRKSLSSIFSRGNKESRL